MFTLSNHWILIKSIISEFKREVSSIYTWLTPGYKYIFQNKYTYSNFNNCNFHFYLLLLFTEFTINNKAISNSLSNNFNFEKRAIMKKKNRI